MKAKVIIVSLLMLVFLFGCAGSKYKIMYGVADWYYTNHVTLQSQYDSATEEEKAFLRANVNPYMNMLVKQLSQWKQ